MTLLLNAVVLSFTHENSYRVTLLFKSTVGLRFFMIYQHSLSHRVRILYRLFHVLFFGVKFFQRKEFCIFSNSLTTW